MTRERPRQIEQLDDADRAALEPLDAFPLTEPADNAQLRSFGGVTQEENTAAGILAGATIASRFRVVEPLGSGAMGVVYKAQDIRLRRMVALKFLTLRSHDTQVIQRFEREARAVSGVSHPNICTLFDIGEYEKRPFLVLELLDGETLQKRIERSTLSLEEILDLGIQIADALDCAHGRGIIHRDIKPANVFVTKTGTAKILDFGVAKLQGGGEHAATDVTDDGHIAGTFAYMSPEQARAEQLDARTDLFSLGAVLYEMATGRPAFSGGTLAVLFDELLNRDPAPIGTFAPQLPETLCSVVSRALEKDREHRYPNALALLAALKNLKQHIRLTWQDSPRPTGFAEEFPGRFSDSLAVLPFENLTGDASSDYLGEGIAENVIDSLSRLRSLRVIPRTTAFRYKANTDPIEAGRTLGVRLVLSGAVRERAGLLIVRAELIDCTEGCQLWGERYERNLSDIFAIEREMAEEIADKLRLRLSVYEKRSLAKQPTDNVEAYRLYLKGRYHVNKWSQEGLKRGVELLHQALEVEPVFPAAYSGLGYVYLLSGFFGAIPPRESFPRAKSSALKALEIEADHPDAHLLLGMVALFFEWDWEQFQTQVRAALVSAPNHANCHWALGYGWLARRRRQDAIAAMEQALRLDPLSAPISMALGHAYYFSRQYGQALKTYKATLEIDPLFVPAYHSLPIVYAKMGLRQEALSTIQHLIDHHQLDDDRLPITRALVCAMFGEADQARMRMSQLEREGTNRYSHGLRFANAMVYANIGEPDKALDLLEQCYEERLPSLTFLADQPEFESLHGHTRFAELVERVGLGRVI